MRLGHQRAASVVLAVRVQAVTPPVELRVRTDDHGYGVRDRLLSAEGAGYQAGQRQPEESISLTVVRTCKHLFEQPFLSDVPDRTARPSGPVSRGAVAIVAEGR